MSFDTKVVICERIRPYKNVKFYRISEVETEVKFITFVVVLSKTNIAPIYEIEIIIKA